MIKLLILLVLSQGTLQSPRRQQARPRHYDQDWMKYMIGEVFFKENSNQGNQQLFEDDDSEEDDTEEIPYSVMEQYNGYEKRYYAPATFVCNNVTGIDTAADPLAGLDDMNPFEIMGSKRYKKRHESQMFMELFRYIAGVNQKQEKIEMTRPVVVFHNVTKETPLGNYEDVCMCFYLPSKYQADHHHTDHQDQRASRHVAEVPPQPLANGAVYLYTAPAHHVFVRRFGGFALTHNHWEREMKALEADLVFDKHSYQQGQYYTAGYNSPWKLHHRRNEVWMQCLESVQPLDSQVEDEKKF